MDQRARNLIVLIAPAYWLSIALLYNGRYWQEFGVNVLAYASFADLVKMAVFPIVTSLLGAAFGGVLGTVPAYITERKSWLKAWIVIAIILVAGLLFGSAASVYLAAFVAVYYFYTSGISFDSLTADRNVWYGASLFLVTIVPLNAYLGAASDARDISMGYEYQFAVEDGLQIRYIGFVGEHFFFLSPQQETIIRHKSALTDLRLARFDKFPDKPAFFFRWFPPPSPNDEPAEPSRPADHSVTEDEAKDGVPNSRGADDDA